MALTPKEFVAALKADARAGADSTVEYLANPAGREPKAPLGELSRWYKKLAHSDQEMVHIAIQYAADGSLFSLLSLLDGVSSVSGAPGSLELNYVEGVSKVRLNDPDGDLLYDLFNNLP